MGALSSTYFYEGGPRADKNYKHRRRTEMKVKSDVKAGKITVNHNQAVKGLSVKAGGVKLNQTVGR